MGWSSYYNRKMTVHNNELYFVADDGWNFGAKLYKTNGTYNHRVFIDNVSANGLISMLEN